VVGGIVEDAGPRASSLAGRSRLGVAHVPDDVVVNGVLGRVHLHVNGGADRQDVGENILGDTAVGVADVPPSGISVAYMPDHIAAEQHVFGAVEFGSGGFPAPLGIGPAAPFDQIVF